MRIICVNTGNKFSEWYVKNLKHMIDTYSGLKYDSFEVIRNNKFEGVFNKLQMFNVEITALFPTGTVYNVAFAFAAGKACPRILYLIAIVFPLFLHPC